MSVNIVDFSRFLLTHGFVCDILVFLCMEVECTISFIEVEYDSDSLLLGYCYLTVNSLKLFSSGTDCRL